MKQVLVKWVWNWYWVGRIYTHIHTYTYIHFFNIYFMRFFFQLSIPIHISIGEDFADFKWIQIFLPALVVPHVQDCGLKETAGVIFYMFRILYLKDKWGEILHLIKQVIKVLKCERMYVHEFFNNMFKLKRQYFCAPARK